MIVDAHVHVWEPRSARFPWRPLGSLAPEFAWTAEQQVAAMDRVGIDKAVLIQMSWYGYDNSYILDCAHRYPRRFAVVGMVDPGSDRLEEQVEQLTAQGISGFRLIPRMRPDIPWLSDRLWHKANEMKLILTLLMSPDQILEAEPIIARYPGVSVVVDHLARADQETDPERPLFRRLLAMAEYPNVYVKVSALAAISGEAYPHVDVLDLVRRALDAYGANRLIWGSDYAMSRDICSMEVALDLITRAMNGSPAEDRALVLGGTATKLWNLAW